MDVNAPVYPGACLLSNNYCPTMRTKIMRKLDAVGLRTLVEMEERVHEHRVKEFYHHLYFTRGESWDLNDPDKKWIKCVYDHTYYELTMKEFGDILEVPTDRGETFYTDKVSVEHINDLFMGISREDLIEEIVDLEYASKCIKTSKIKVKHLKDKLQLMYRIIRENVTCRALEKEACRTKGAKYVTAMEAMLLHWIKNGIQIDMGFIMANIMMDASIEGGAIHFPLGMRLTKLFKHFNIADEPSMVVPRKPLV